MGDRRCSPRRSELLASGLAGFAWPVGAGLAVEDLLFGELRARPERQIEDARLRALAFFSMEITGVVRGQPVAIVADDGTAKRPDFVPGGGTDPFELRSDHVRYIVGKSPAVRLTVGLRRFL